MDFFLDTNNLFLLIIAITSGAMLMVHASVKGTGRGGMAVSVNDAVQLANREHGVFVDIRPAAQFQASSIPQARNLPQADIEAQAASLPKDKPVILVCDSGRVAGGVAARLRKLGVSRAVSMQGGLNGWSQAGLPLKPRK